MVSTALRSSQPPLSPLPSNAPPIPFSPANPPPTPAGIEQVGILVVDFSSLDLNQFDSKWDPENKVTVYKVPFKIFIKLGDKQGTLTLRSEIAGKAAGDASIDFSGH